MPNHQSFLRSGYLLPRILLLWAVIDVALRYAPPRWYSFRLHEFAMVTGSRGLGPFRTNMTYENSRAYGDLAELGNCTECRQYRPTLVHTDERGFANPASAGPYDAILIGDSFGIGAEQPSGETLASQISSRTGLSIYNACSPVRAISREELMSLIDQLGLSHGIVFFELMDWSLGFYSLAQQESGFRGLERLSKNVQYSPLTNMSRQLVGPLYDGRFLPNPYSVNVIRKRLPGGESVLFQLDDVQNAAPDSVKLWAKYFRVLDRELRARDFNLIVVFVPSKYTTYQPLIKDAAPTNKSAQFEELQKQLHGVAVVNAVPAMQKAAAAAFAQGRLIYWRDDTHWNAEGVRVAADQISALYAAEYRTSRRARVEAVSQTRVR